jgi:hypothetical protein
MKALSIDREGVNAYIKGNPNEKPKGRLYSGSYDNAYEAMGFRVLLEEWVGDFAGDILFLVKDQKDTFGLIVAGYGSCSGCDVMQDVNGPKEECEVAEGCLDESLCGTLEEIAAHIEAERAENRWWRKDRDVDLKIKQWTEVMKEGVNALELYIVYKDNGMGHVQALTSAKDALHTRSVKVPKSRNVEPLARS